MNIEELGEQLFNNEPRPPHSIQIEFEGFETEDLFKSLCMILTHGMKKLYGNENGKVELNKLSNQQINKINDYFKSMGLIFFINDSNYTRISEVSQFSLKIKGDWSGEIFFDYFPVS